MKQPSPALMPRWAGRFAFLAVLTALSGAAQSTVAPPPLVPHPLGSGPGARPLDANEMMELENTLVRQKNFDAANLERKKQIDDDSARLLKLAGDLKAEVDKTSKDTLSLSVIRKADEIETLAHSVKEKMKLTVGGS